MYNKFHRASLFERLFQFCRGFFDGTGTAAGGVFPILSFIITLTLGAASVLTGPFALLSIGGAYGLFLLVASTWSLTSLKNSNKDLKALLEKMQRSDKELQEEIAELFWIYLKYLYLRNNSLYKISGSTLEALNAISLSLDVKDFNLGVTISPALQTMFNKLLNEFNEKKLNQNDKHFVINRENITNFVKESFKNENALGQDYDNYRREVFYKPLTKWLPIFSSAYKGSLIISGCSIGPLAGALGVIAMFAGISVLTAIPIVGWSLLGGALALTLIIGTIGFSYYMYKNQKRTDYIASNKSTSADLNTKRETLQHEIKKIKKTKDYQYRHNPYVKDYDKLLKENKNLRSVLKQVHYPTTANSSKFFKRPLCSKLLIENSSSINKQIQRRRCAASAS